MHTLYMYMYVAINAHVFHLIQMLSNVTFFRDRKINPYFVLYINESIFFFQKQNIFWVIFSTKILFLVKNHSTPFQVKWLTYISLYMFCR